MGEDRRLLDAVLTGPAELRGAVLPRPGARQGPDHDWHIEHICYHLGRVARGVTSVKVV